MSDERKKRKWSIEDDKAGEDESQPYKDGPKKVVYDTSDGSYLSYESDELSSFGSESEEEDEKILVDSKQLGIGKKGFIITFCADPFRNYYKKCLYL